MQPIHIAAKIGCTEVLKYIGTLPGVDVNAVTATVKCKLLYKYVAIYVLNTSKNT